MVTPRFLRLNTSTLAALYLMLAANLPLCVFASGLSTRDQNPLLQSYYLPAISAPAGAGWHGSQSLFVTNTFQQEVDGNEALTMDVEIYRYEFSINYQWDLWRLNITAPLIFYRRGNLDVLIEQFHEVFNFPDGGRPSNPDNRINIRYIRDGQTLFYQSVRDSGLGDVAISMTRELFPRLGMTTSVSIGVEAPTGELAVFGDSEAIDYGFWLIHDRSINTDLSLYGMIGWSFLDDEGVLGEYVHKRVRVIQLGGEYRLTPHVLALLQFDLHSEIVKSSSLDTLGDSTQAQFGVRVQHWIAGYDIDLFFSEDIQVGSAPDITFAIRLTRSY